LDSDDLCYGHGTDNPLDEAFYFIYGLLGIDFADEQAAQRELNVGEEAMLEAAVKRRIDESVPTAYLVGRAWFAGHEFFCDDRALVPRSPLAELINGEFDPLLREPTGKVLDMCTGGGSIALHGLGSRVRVIQSDLFDDVDSRYDLIIANPPYVSVQEYEWLPAEFINEPSLGLINADNGLQIPLKILQDSVDYLSADGLLVMEVGYSQPQLSERLRQVPLLWLEFAQGGEGVLALTARQLQQYREQFN
jgi:ribosomal protein L3 glutamine methyltransferase